MQPGDVVPVGTAAGRGHAPPRRRPRREPAASLSTSAQGPAVQQQVVVAPREPIRLLPHPDQRQPHQRGPLQLEAGGGPPCSNCCQRSCCSSGGSPRQSCSCQGSSTRCQTTCCGRCSSCQTKPVRSTGCRSTTRRQAPGRPPTSSSPSRVGSLVARRRRPSPVCIQAVEEQPLLQGRQWVDVLHPRAAARAAGPDARPDPARASGKVRGRVTLPPPRCGNARSTPARLPPTPAPVAPRLTGGVGLG